VVREQGTHEDAPRVRVEPVVEGLNVALVLEAFLIAELQLNGSVSERVGFDFVGPSQ